MLLDIQMPKLDGFEVVELLERELPMVFITAYDEHALRAFEVHAVDYLLKPYSAERLAEAIERARGRIGLGDASPSLDELVSAARPDGGDLERILVRDGSDVRVIPVESVDYIEAQDDAVAIHVGGVAHLKAQRLATLGERLDTKRFIRVHRSIHPQYRSPAQHRALCQGQPHRDPRGWRQGAGQSVGICASSRIVVNNPLGFFSRAAILAIRPFGRRDACPTILAEFSIHNICGRRDACPTILAEFSINNPR